ncbi:MAG: GWxTD domain-containing protein [Acidobacteria bacterium]|nr:GWxTD domain-containing protein [Acidobacteriota bacterium]
MRFSRFVILFAFLGFNLNSGVLLFGFTSTGSSGKDGGDQINYYKKWIDEDVLYIITEDEKATFKALRNDEERENFIEQFWLRRNPDQRIGDNPFREEHYRRIAYANQHFSSGMDGWRTDRGRIYIMYGPPDQRETHPTGGMYYRRRSEGGGMTSTLPWERWWYRHIEGLGNDIEIEFVDPTNSGEYRMAMDPGEKDALTHVEGLGLTTAEELGLADKRDRPYLSPYKWNEMSNPNRANMWQKDSPFAKMEQYFNLQRPPQIKYEDLKIAVSTRISYNPLPYSVRMDYIRLSSEKVLVPITVDISNRNLEFKKELDVNRASLNVYGMITTLTGRIEFEFEEEIAAEFSDDNFEKGKDQRSQFQKLVSLRPGQRYKLDLVLKDVNSEKMGTQTIPLAVPKYEEGILQSSSIILARSVKQAPTNMDRLEQYVLGDLKVVPMVHTEYLPGQNLIPYMQIYNVAIDQTDLKPVLEITYTLKRDEEILAQVEDISGSTVQLFSGERVVLLAQIPLNDFTPGEYTLEISILDAIANRTHEASTDFTVIEPEEPSPEAVPQ